MEKAKSRFATGLTIAIVVAVIGGILYLAGSANNTFTTTPGIGARDGTGEIKLAARRSSVQPVFYTPCLYVTFSQPLPVAKKFTEKEIKELIDSKISALESKLAEEAAENQYSRVLSDVDTWVEPKGRTYIPIGSLPGVPEWAKFPDRVLVVSETEDKEIDPYVEEYKDDVRSISEMANVSLPKAKEILTRIKTAGYSVFKEEIKEDSVVKLLHFSSGWDDKYPGTLSWEVVLEGEESNLITGYDPRGIIEIRSVPKDKKVHVKCGYFNLRDEFLPDSDEVKKLKEDKELLRDRIKALEEKDEEKPIKRDISTATWFDVAAGIVKLERLWFMSWGSGIFLGNMTLSPEMEGRNLFPYYAHDNNEMGVVLTNHHVAAAASRYEILVSPDKERMLIIFPAIPFIRHTQESDSLGSPALILAIDGALVESSDFDCALMVTTPIKGLPPAKLGNSDLAENGDEIIMVGNPSITQKLSTQGIISNKNYNLLNSVVWNAVDRGFPKGMITRWKNSSFYIDAPIGCGGTSGSGIFALYGPQRGKVIALHNSGLVRRLSEMSKMSEPTTLAGCEEGKCTIPTPPSPSEVIKDSAKNYKNVFFEEDEFKNIQFLTMKDDDPIGELAGCGSYVELSGVHAGVPINKIKAFLQERGIDPADFGWDGVDESHWEQ